MKFVHRHASLQFDPEPIGAVLAQIFTDDWLPHAPEPLGDASLPLIAVGGTANLDYAIAGPLQPTPWLDQCSSLSHLLHAFNLPLSRCRLMRLSAHTALPAAVDHSYQMFRRHMMIIPLVTDPSVRFCCQYGDQKHEMHLYAGWAWTFDHTQPHRLINESSRSGIHLVIESRGEAEDAPQGLPRVASDGCQSSWQEDPQPASLPIEPYQFEVLTPQEIDPLLTVLLGALTATAMPQTEVEALKQRLTVLQHRWEQLFTRFGHQPAGELAYQDLLLQIEGQLTTAVQEWLPDCELVGRRAFTIIRSMLWTAPRPEAVVSKNRNAPSAPTAAPRKGSSLVGAGQRMLSRQINLRRNSVASITPPVFTHPLFIVSAPRSGSTLLFETLMQFPSIWSIGVESHELIEGIPALHPAAHGYCSNRLTTTDVTPAIRAALHKRFAHHLQDRVGQSWRTMTPPQQSATVRLLEKTPKNALRIPFLKAVFPDARFLFLYREPLANISSMMEGWRLQRFQPGYRLPGWPYQQVAWSFLLVPGWETLVERPIAEIAAYQWRVANETILDDLATLAPEEWQLVHYDDLVHQPQPTVRRLAAFAKLPWDEHIEQILAQPLPVSSKTVSAPRVDKWRKRAWLLPSIQPIVEPVVVRVAQITGVSPN